MHCMNVGGTVFTREKNIFRNRWCSGSRIVKCERMKLCSYFILHKNYINYKWIIVLNVRANVIKLVRKLEYFY